MGLRTTLSLDFFVNLPPNMSITLVAILILSGILVGFINTLSAGGTIISIALYIALGIPVQTTNAINRVGVLIQNGFASLIFYRKHIINYRILLLNSLPIIMGTFIGSTVAVKLDQRVFNICFAIVLLIIIVFLFIDNKINNRKERKFNLKNYLITFPLFLIIGFYGGFVQVGTGFLLIAILGSLLGHDLIKTTAIKNTLMFIYTIVAMIVFVSRGDIETKYWFYGLTHSVGNVIGSYFAVRYALKKGNKFIRLIIISIIIFTALNLLGIIDIKIIFKNIVN